MGEAKRRGTFEQRKAEGIIKRQAEEKEKEEARNRFMIAHKPSKNSVVLASILIATGALK